MLRTVQELLCNLIGLFLGLCRFRMQAVLDGLRRKRLKHQVERLRRRIKFCLLTRELVQLRQQRLAPLLQRFLAGQIALE